MPALTIPPGDPPTPRSESPPRPPISPITPPLNPTDLGIAPSLQPQPQSESHYNLHRHHHHHHQHQQHQHQQAAPNTNANIFARTHAYSHSQPDQVAIPQPPPIPISLDANPDAIALRAALAALQVQKMRATTDIRALSAAKHHALQNPLDFTRDLLAGRVQTRETFATSAPAATTTSASASTTTTTTTDDTDNGAENNQGDAGPHAWRSLPRPQDVVRCPPINWSQYAVVGESLDRLHAEQLAAPAQGAPATLGPAGVYEFRAGPGPAAPEAYRGVASPYSPLRDTINAKAKRR